MARYIDADRSIRGLKEEAVRIKPNEVVMGLVDNIVDWLEKQPTCSVCGEHIAKNSWGGDYFSDGCPRCRAKMDIVAKEVEGGNAN